jgi:AP-2 complex subunit alpha
VNIYDIQENSASYEETVSEAPKENGGPVEVERKVEIITETVPESKVEPPTSHSPSQADLLADLLGPLAIEGPPAAVEQNPVQVLEANQTPIGDLALATLDDQSSAVQVLLHFLITLFVPLSGTTDSYTPHYQVVSSAQYAMLSFIFIWD